MNDQKQIDKDELDDATRESQHEIEAIDGLYDDQDNDMNSIGMIK